MKQTLQIVLNTCPDQISAETIAEQLVTSKLAACVNILPLGTSLYLWQNKLEKNKEHLLLIKIPADNYDAVEEFIRAKHPYENPEVIALAVKAGAEAYLDWVFETTKK